MTRDDAVVRVMAAPDPELKSLAETLVQTPDKLNPQAVRALGWTAIPVAVDEEAADVAVPRLASAMQSIQVAECAALLLEQPSGQPECLTFPASAEGLFAFDRARIVFRYLVTGRPAKFALLYSQEFYVIAGPQGFVTDAVGCSPEDARARFDEYAAKWLTRNARGHVYFTDIAHHYRQP